MTVSSTEDENPNLNNILALIDTKFQLLQKRQKDVQTAVLYQPRSLPHRNQYVMMTRVEVEYALRVLAESHFGSQELASSLSGWDQLLEILEKEKIINAPLANDIKDFYRFTIPFIREPFSNDVYIQIQYLSSDILERLHQIPLGPHIN